MSNQTKYCEHFIIILNILFFFSKKRIFFEKTLALHPKNALLCIGINEIRKLLRLAIFAAKTRYNYG
jgi:hypothetical protein